MTTRMRRQVYGMEASRKWPTCWVQQPFRLCFSVYLQGIQIGTVMDKLHDKRLTPLFELMNQLRRMDHYHKGRSPLVLKIHVEKKNLLRDGVGDGQIQELIQDRLARFEQ